MNDLLEGVELLSTRLDDLEKRVHALEHPAEAFKPAVAMPLAVSAGAIAVEEESIERAGGMFYVLGKAMLGIAGAYVLRAVAAFGVLPERAIAAVAIAYAIAWMAWAARESAKAYFAAAVYAGTSALILAPMLWELTLHFKVFTPVGTAGVFAGFVVVATALAWRQDRSPVFWVAQAAAATSALALSIATHEMLPFAASLLLMVLICEWMVARQRDQAIRPLVAVVADIAVLALIFVYSGPLNSRADYPALGIPTLLAPGCVLFLINAAGIAVRTALLRQRVTFFDTVQAIIAFLLAAANVLNFAPRSAAIALGVVCLFLTVACYVVAFVSFRNDADQRNFHVFAIFGAGLLLAGTLWSLPPDWMAASLGLAALAAIASGTRLTSHMLDFHGVLYIASAAVASGLLIFVFRSLAGPLPAKPGWSVYVVSFCAVLCYALGRERQGEAWREQVFHLIPALLAASSVAALVARGLMQIAALRVNLDVFHVAFIRTLSVCAVAMALAFGGSRWRRLEMTRIAYGALAFVAAKLLFEDLRHGRMEFIAASIFLFAIALIGVPRLARIGHRT